MQSSRNHLHKSALDASVADFRNGSDCFERNVARKRFLAAIFLRIYYKEFKFNSNVILLIQ